MSDNFKNICVVSCGVCARAAAECSAEGLTHSALLPAACWARLPLVRAGQRAVQGLRHRAFPLSSCWLCSI